MATVYKAYDTRLERDVAVKLLRTDQFAPAMLERILKRFEREAKSLARLSHPNIVHINDYGEQDGVPYLVMEYLPGGTLKSKMAKPMPWQEAVQLVVPIAQALRYAHDNKIIHRDIKPSNILLTQNGQPMLTDFGIAKLLEREEIATLTATGFGVGTPGYMSPEQWTGQSTPQSDIYSLGVVLYELVTGRKPYAADTPAAILLKQANEPLPLPSLYARELPQSVESLLIKALDKDPAYRFVDMNAVIVALEKLLLVQVKAEPPLIKKIVVNEKPKGGETISNPIPKKAVFKTVLNKPKQISGFSLKVTTIIFGAVMIIIAIGGVIFLNENFLTEPLPSAINTIFPTSTIQISLTVKSSLASPTLNLPTLTPTIVSDITTVPTLVLGAIQVSAIDGMTLHYIPDGTFTMGDTAEHASLECQRTGPPPDGCDLDRFTNEEPIHQVYLDAFWMDETEVTNAMYKLCVKTGTCKPPDTLDYYSNSQFNNWPVVFLTWDSANTYCQWAQRRLPTEAEWEKAARGTDGRTYPWGETVGKQYANYNLSVGDSTDVGSYELGKSPYGLYDMAGNVWEIVADWYSENYYASLSENVSNPQGPTSGDGRVAKGGSSLYNDIRSASRGGVRSSVDIGFRCAMDAKP